MGYFYFQQSTCAFKIIMYNKITNLVKIKIVKEVKMFSKIIISKNNLKFIALTAIAITLCLSLVSIAMSTNAEAKPRVKIAKKGKITKLGKNKYKLTATIKFAGGGKLTNGSSSFCERWTGYGNSAIAGPGSCEGSIGVKQISSKKAYVYLQPIKGKPKKKLQRLVIVNTNTSHGDVRGVVTFKR